LNRKRTLLTGLKFSVGLLILAVLLRKVGFSDLWVELRGIDWAYAPLILPVFLSTLGVGAVSIHVLLRALGERIPFGRMARYYCTSWAYGLFVPGKLGEFSLVYFLAREGTDVGRGTFVALLDKVVTLFCFALVSLLGLFAYLDPGLHQPSLPSSSFVQVWWLPASGAGWAEAC